MDIANYNEAEIFNIQGYNIYNLSSEFYTDKCTGANICGNDIVIKDRLDEIYPNNASLCSNGCELNSVKIQSKRVKCSCNISFVEDEEKIEINTNQTKLNASDNFAIYLLDSLNYKIFGCYKIILKLQFKDLISNIGFFFGIGFILFNIICFIIFLRYYLPKMRIQIYKLLPSEKKFIKVNKNEAKSKINKTSKEQINSTINFAKNHVKIKKTERKDKINKYSDRNILNNNRIIVIDRNETNKNYTKIEENDFNCLPYCQAIKLDKRNFFIIYMSLIKMKIDIISILFFPEEFTHKSLTLSEYSLDFIFSFFINALLYTDDIVSEKYHNNGKLNFFTTVFLSLTSNIISFITMYFIKQLVSYNEYFSRMTREIIDRYEYILTFQKLYLLLKIKILSFFTISFILSLFFSFYILIFCEIYKMSQVSLLVNFIMGLIESFAYSVVFSFIITILRYLGLKLQIINLYKISVYLDKK